MSMHRVLACAAALSLSTLAGCVPPPAPGVVVEPSAAYLGSNCSAGFYQCAMPTPQQAGTPCACPGLGAPSYGVVR